ncbi:hypothetical protein RB653_008944 [Dictyostelium firmibasis]|uniref:LysM domain-containing protein n=1 Tax=Dictyostelium firmibasis TaxID=79012 RepID=A0AAN7U0Y3_9MYCE
MNKLLSLLAVVLVLCVFSFGVNAETEGRCSAWYVAEEGYTCWDMSRGCRVSLQSFMDANGLDLNSCNYIQIGKKYCCN